MTPRPPIATLVDLARTEGQAELIGGRIVTAPPFGCKPARIAGNLHTALAEYADRVGRGYVGTATLGYVIPELPSGRRSFCADASYFDGPLPENLMGFIEGPPTFAIEIRDLDDDPATMAAKRSDYFAAGTRVVWDLDPMAEFVLSYRSDQPDTPFQFGRGQTADAEPALPGWRVELDRIFP